MELVYIRITETNHNHNFSFVGKDLNFHGEYTFFYNTESGQINFERNKEYVENLYGSDIRVSGIVGANGVGKTSLLKFIQYLIAQLNGHEQNHSYIFDTWQWIGLIRNENGHLKAISSIRSTNSFSLSDAIQAFVQYNSNLFNVVENKISSTSIYYSPHFDLTEPNFDKPDYIDVSSDFLIYKEARSKEEGDQDVSQIVHFRRNDIKRQIDFIEYTDNLENENIVFYNAFRRNEISLRFHEFSKKFNSDPKYLDITDCRHYKKLDELFINRNSTIIHLFHENEIADFKELGLLRFYRRLVEIIFDCVEYRPEPKQDYEGNYRKKISDGFNVDPNNITLSYENFLKSLVVIAKETKEHFLFLIEKIKFILNEFVTYDEADECFKCSLEKAQNLIIIEKNIFAILPYKSNLELFNFDWNGMSTGEKAYLNLFSRIHDGLNILRKHPVLNNSNLIYFLIDEPASGFHPQWQKEYLSKLLEFLKHRLGSKFRIIISSHSTFLISDLQKQDVISLSNTKDIFNIDNTFGANIHELLADSFFLQNGFIGDFSKDKIQDLIRFLNFDSNSVPGLENEKPIENWSVNRAQKLIRIVGEPIIKERLQEMYDNKFKSIADLKEEIKRLENIIRNKQ